MAAVWTEVDRDELDGRPLVLYRAPDDALMIRVDGMELMNSRWHQSEDELGELAAHAAGVQQPRILLGGLGLGYTLLALERALAGRGQVTVAEVSAAVVRWFGTWTRPILFPGWHPNARVVAADVADLLQPGAGYDVICLDVDNGPQPLSLPANGYLYEPQGLAAMRAALAPGGVILVWSAFEDPRFEAAGGAAGLAVTMTGVVHPDRPELEHTLYQLRAAAT
jgi:spermidine synthase